MNVEEKYRKWLNSPIPEDLRKQLEEMDRKDIYDAFYTDLEFDTAGMRGILGPGSNRMNVYMVRKATVGFAKYLLKTDPDVRKKGVVISHDNRLYSREFTLETAKVFASYGIRAYIFDDLRPTPELSFAIRYLGTSGGVMITASHNPKEYNGYKVYDDQGCQLTPDKIQPLLRTIASLGNELDVGYGIETEKGEILTLGKDVDEQFVEKALSIQLNPDLDKEDFRIVFSPQHGTSLERARDIFERLGYSVTYVKEQCTHDPLFSNTSSPNPELREAFDLSLEYAKKIDADLLVTTDPDADRIGIAVKDRNGEYAFLTGNQTGALLIHYILSQRRERNLLKPNSVIIDTVVTSSFGKRIARFYGVDTESVLTGFKFIGEKIHQYEQSGEKTFEFGYEESYGCLISPYVRDKDSLQAMVMILEMTNYYLKKRKTLDVVLDDLMKNLGYYDNRLYSIYFKGSNGKEKMGAILERLRSAPIRQLDGRKLVQYEDYLSSNRYDSTGLIIEKIALPKTNLIKLYFEDGSSLAIRPSGTEPKCKFYFEAVSPGRKENEGKCERMFAELKNLLGIGE